MKRWMVFIIPLALITMYMNCGLPRIMKPKELSLPSVSPDDPLSPKPGSVSIDFCTSPGLKLDSSINYYFVVDTSGSNTSTEFGNIPTDRCGIKRFESIKSFINNPTIPNNGASNFALIEFATLVTEVEILPGSKITNNKNLFTTKVEERKDRAVTLMAGYTNYTGALDVLKTRIGDDITANVAAHKASTYFVFFITDGMPMDSNGEQNADNIVSAVASIQALATTNANKNFVNGIIFNTGFYFANSDETCSHDLVTPSPSPSPGGTPVPTPNEDVRLSAVGLLTRMAQAGFGTFVDFGTSFTFDFNQFLTSEQMGFELREVWVENLNTVWWEDKFLVDSDEDLIPDEAEIQKGTTYKDKVNHRDMDGNGVSEGVQYFTSSPHEPCVRRNDGTGGCLTSTSRPPECNDIPFTVVGTKNIFSDSDRDGLNDCEERLLSQAVKSDEIDSNDDDIPDGFAFRHSYTLTGVASQKLDDWNHDGIPNYNKLQAGLPLMTSPEDLDPLFRPMRHSRVETTAGPAILQRCYHQTVDDIIYLPVETPNGKKLENEIQIYILESQIRNSSRKKIRRVIKNSTPTQVLNIKDSDFEALD